MQEMGVALNTCPKPKKFSANNLHNDSYSLVIRYTLEGRPALRTLNSSWERAQLMNHRVGLSSICAIVTQSGKNND